MIDPLITRKLASLQQVLQELRSLGALVSFRNLVVHPYDDVDPSILAHVVNQRLVDFDRFVEEVLSSHAG